MYEKIEVYNEDVLLCTIWANYSEERIRVESHVSDTEVLPFGTKKKPKWRDYVYFISTRVCPPTRGNMKEVLKAWGLQYYDPDALCRKTHGVMCEDRIWLKYEGEEISYEDVQLHD